MLPQSPPFPLADYSFAWGPVSLELSAAPDVDQLLLEDLDLDRIPYWSFLWSAAPALARWLVERGGWEGVPVLELGCGVGLAGMAAAALGARVTQTDYFPEALVLSRENARRNGIEGVRYAAADWRAWPLRGTWPLLLGSDITYERTLHDALLATLGRSLAPGGTAYLADPGRPMSLDFFTGAEGAGWRVELHPAPQPPGGTPVWVYALRRRQG